MSAEAPVAAPLAPSDADRPHALASPASASPVRQRLEYLDGIRGIVATMVVLAHLSAFASVPRAVAVFGLANWVAVFITLSGFCLYLPAANRDRPAMPRPFWPFMRRRALRILPPWYASLAMCTAVGWLFVAAGYTPPFSFVPADWLDVLTHATLLHSMTLYSGSINGPGYTLGTEWQLYVLLLPFLLIARKASWPVLLGLVVGAAAAPVPGIPGKLLHKVLSPTFTTPFVIGMLSARLAYRWRGLPPVGTPRGERLTLLLLAGVTLAAIAGYVELNPRSVDLGAWCAALAAGATCLLLQRRPRCAPARLLASRPARTLGTLSFSLYLVHFPLLALLAFAAWDVGVPADRAWYLVQLPGLVVIFAFAYAFYLAFEKPFAAGFRPADWLRDGLPAHLSASAFWRLTGARAFHR
jgi:peptidoglycan/LPS O-acetylase OafA/YrhL